MAVGDTAQKLGELFDVILQYALYSGINVTNVRHPDFEAGGDGTKDDTTAILAANAALTSGGILYFPPGVYRLSADFTFEENVTLLFANGAMLKLDPNITVTIKGPVDAGLYQIFSGSGTISLGNRIDFAYPQWWGAKADGENDDSEAIGRTIRESGGRIRFPKGNYLLMKVVDVSGLRGLTLSGDPGSCLLIPKVDSLPDYYRLVIRNSSNIVIQGLEFAGDLPTEWVDSHAALAILDGSEKIWIERCYFHDFGGSAWLIATVRNDTAPSQATTNAVYMTHNLVENVKQTSTTTGGLHSAICSDNIFRGIKVSIKFASRAPGSSKLLISNNLFVDSVVEQNALEVQSYVDLLVTGNLFENIGRKISDSIIDAIYYKPNQKTSASIANIGRINITNNTIHAVYGNGMRIIGGNTAEEPLKHVTITGNIVNDVELAGVRLEGADSYFEDVVIQGNNFYEVKSSAISGNVKRLVRVVVEGNTSVKNRTDAVKNSSDIYMNVRDIVTNSQLKVMRNTLQGHSDGNGIALFNFIQAIVDGNVVTNVSGAGIQLYRCQGAIIRNNICNDNSGDGLDLHNIDGGAIQGNTLMHNKGAGLRIRDTSENVYLFNHLSADNGLEDALGPPAKLSFEPLMVITNSGVNRYNLLVDSSGRVIAELME